MATINKNVKRLNDRLWKQKTHGVWEGLWFVIVALPGLFSYLFFHDVFF